MRYLPLNSFGAGFTFVVVSSGYEMMINKTTQNVCLPSIRL